MFPKIFIYVDEALSSAFIYPQMFGTNIHDRVMHVIVLIGSFSKSPYTNIQTLVNGEMSNLYN
jgi:hypothetical protein